MRGDRQRGLLQSGDVLQIKAAAMELLDIVAGKREPEWHALVRVARVDCDKRVARAVVAGEEQHPAPLIAIPIIEEEITPTPNVAAVAPDVVFALADICRIIFCTGLLLEPISKLLGGVDRL